MIFLKLGIAVLVLAVAWVTGFLQGSAAARVNTAVRDQLVRDFLSVWNLRSKYHYTDRFLVAAIRPLLMLFPVRRDDVKP